MRQEGGMPFDEYFWRLKTLYPGDPDFSWEGFPSLPYSYVVIAYVRGTALYRERMHDMERPTAMVSSILANQNRDPKKSKKVLGWEDFTFYKPRVGGENVSYVYGSAMLKLVKTQQMPSWALFCFKEVTATASEAYVPSCAALIAEDAMLLHPVKDGNGWTGMLIAQESASEQTRTFTGEDGTIASLTVPHVYTKVICKEGVTLSP